jgi:hypothetical protein
MPGFDRTGPLGEGPGTGWSRGPCGAGRRRGGGRVWGRGFGRGAGAGSWGQGRFAGGPRWGYGPRRFGPFGYGGAAGYGAPPDEAQALQDEEAYLRSQLEAVQQRLLELEGSEP